jgi:acyl-CoA reductase-like NAD-dependent aldehyde dehydrogenase
MNAYEKLYIDGEWVDPAGTGHFDVTNASTEETLGRVPAGSRQDATRAVAAAARAFAAWSARPLAERAELVERVAGLLEARKAELASTIAAEVGMPIKLATPIQAAGPIAGLRGFAALARQTPLEETVGNSLVVRQPVGVVACITPWNYPLHQVVNKVGPALLAGCTVVLKPSEVAPLSAFMLAEAVHQAGLPPGVFNLVSGDGPTVGEALADDPRVDMVSFTGSTRAGRRVAELCARSIKRLALELGGKSASLLLDDLAGPELEKAVRTTVNMCFLNSGQTCSAWTRLLVPRARLAEVNALARGAAEKMTLGDALKGEGRLGPLASAAQRERVRGYIRRGLDEGATLLTGGADPPDGLARGYFVRPTVLTDVKPEMTVAQEEIFGPVLCIVAYDSVDEAVGIANGTVYGLGGAVWGSDVERARRVARRLRTGQVDINGGAYNPLAPFGGFKQSGLGREGGRFGLDEYLELQSLQQ